MKSKSKFVPVGDDQRQADAAKTARLRALRLAKEAADKDDAAAQAAVAAASKPQRRRAPSALQADRPKAASERGRG